MPDNVLTTVTAADARKYFDEDGKECCLAVLCRRSPDWAASRIARMEQDGRDLVKALNHAIDRAEKAEQRCGQLILAGYGRK